MLELRWTGLAESAVKEDQKLRQWEYEEAGAVWTETLYWDYAMVMKYHGYPRLE